MVRHTKRAAALEFAFIVSLVFAALVPSGKVHAIPAWCNYDSTSQICCPDNGPPIPCTFPAPPLDLYCRGTIVPNGGTFPY